MSRQSHIGGVRVGRGEHQTTVGSGPAAGATAYTIGSVTSTDGTAIGYRSLGHGPGAVVLRGTMSSGHNHGGESGAGAR